MTAKGAYISSIPILDSKILPKMVSSLKDGNRCKLVKQRKEVFVR